MRTLGVAPTGATRTFAPDQVIVSKTDLTGRITYANEVFLDVAKFAESELMGQPHNVVRHPDMPRVVFKLLWDEIEAGREIFAYVKNLAKDGVAYWVFAHVTPTRRDGRIVSYHSNRRAPDPSSVSAIAPIYAAILDEERKHQHPVEAMRAGGELLGKALAAQNVTYDEFVWSITKVAP